jgi:hypothetical protein
MPVGTPQQVQFIDPAGLVPTYTWQVNPGYQDITQPAGKQRQIDRVALSSNIGAVRQQGDDGDIVLHWEPLIYHASQETALWQFYQLSKKQSIYLVDFNGEKYEGQITTCQRQQIGALAGPGDINTRLFYCKYVFEFDVWQVLSGPIFDAGVTI